MPSQPACFHRLEEIFTALRAMTSTHLDRAAVEKLFRVRQRRARQIMAGLEGLRVGNAAAVSREALIARLERTADGGVFQWEGNRRARLVEDLDRLRRQLAARRVRIPAAADVRERLPEDLSAGIALRPENCGSHLAVPRTWRPGCSKSRRRWPTIGPPSAGPLRKTTRPPRGGKA